MLHFRDLAWSELFLFASSFDFRIYNNRLFEKNIENSRKAYYMIVKVAMPIWLVLRLFTVYDVSGLMPYYLDFRL